MGAHIQLLCPVGDRYGRLTVLAEAPRAPRSRSNGQEQRRWLCRCDCGQELVTQMNNIRSGRTKSCGCQYGTTNRAEAMRNLWIEQRAINAGVAHG